MIGHDGTLLANVTVGIPAIILSIALLLVGAYVWHRYAEDAGEFWSLGWVPVIGVLALVIAPLFGYYPYDADYHRLQPVSGVVADVKTRTMDTYYVITYREGAVVRCDDSRCANVKVGDTLNLLCTKEHQWGSPKEADGWGCRWGKQ